MLDVPAWLWSILADAASPQAATEHLLFHGTLESFEGPLTASQWEQLRWTSDNPCVAQSYCPATGSSTGWSAPESWRLEERLLPCGPINQIIFRELGFNEDDLDARKDHTGRIESWRILPNHPRQSDAVAFMKNLGYDTSETMCWVKTQRRGDHEIILPADYRAPGRMFILERPADLRIYDYSRKVDGGLTGRQWNHSDVFRKVAASGNWDGIKIDDIHQSEELGHFGHESFGLFGPTLERLRYHVISIVHFDPGDCKPGDHFSTTPEFDALWRSCQPAEALAA